MDTYTSLKSEEFTLFEVEELGIRKPSAAKKQGSKGYIRTKGFFCRSHYARNRMHWVKLFWARKCPVVLSTNDARK
jgi:hypothetical protein